tara:strand:- start:2253 stop:3599 length:1347 start_codon:yes stop_codon:yes gene_type:complete
MLNNFIKNIIFITLSTTFILAHSVSDAFIKVSEKANPAVVSIVGKKDMQNNFSNDPFYQYFPEFYDFFDMPEGFGTSLGSGVIIDKNNGYILTNNHVVDDTDEISVILFDKREFNAELIGSDELSDLALLQIDSDDLMEIELGDSDKLSVGQWVVAIGSPFQQSLSNTVTAGIVSAVGRNDIISNKNIENFIQHDAAINPGNSGGALLNLDGKLIGINTAIATGNSWSPQNAGIGFAIPVNQAKRVIEDLLTIGTVERGFLGVSIQDLDAKMAESLGMKNAGGTIIVEVVEDSPAYEAGLKEGDVILEVDGKRVDNSSKLKLLISSNRPGDETKLLILSNKNKKTVYVTLDKYPEDNISQKPEKDFDLLGVIVSDGNGKGVEIKKIDKKSNAYRSGLRTGDLILSIDNQKINTKSDYKKLVNDLKQGDIVMMQTSRNGRKTFIAFNIN